MEDFIFTVDRIIKYAEDNFHNPCFVFGEEVYTLQEAFDAMLDHGEDEMEEQDITLEEYVERKKRCCHENGLYSTPPCESK